MRLIDADALIDKFKSDARKSKNDISFAQALMYAVTCIDYEADWQPTIEQPKWISCEERLPGKSGTYIVRSESGAVYTSHFYAEKLCASGYIRAACWTKRGKKEVLDWMPLPPKGAE